MQQNIILRHPVKKDGLSIYHLVKSCPPLDLNSPYYYYIMCDDFGETSVIAQINNEIVGFISGYLSSKNNSKYLFIWQVAVSKKARGKGIASRMLSYIIQESIQLGISEIRTTISPSNLASQRLFNSYAQSHQLHRVKKEYLRADDFGAGDHESEELYIIKLNNSINKGACLC